MSITVDQYFFVLCGPTPKGRHNIFSVLEAIFKGALLGELK